MSELPVGAVPGSSLVVEGVTFKLHSSAERDDIGVRLWQWIVTPEQPCHYLHWAYLCLYTVLWISVWTVWLHI